MLFPNFIPRLAFVFIFLLLVLSTPLDLFAGGHHYGGHKSPRISYSAHHSSGSTYKIGNTRYKFGQTYKTSGLPQVERSTSAKKQFLKSRGYIKEPQGMEVDHITPLSKGGSDSPDNMQLLTKQQHKAKTASERAHK